jgi:hypothetical protein
MMPTLIAEHNGDQRSLSLLGGKYGTHNNKRQLQI